MAATSTDERRGYNSGQARVRLHISPFDSKVLPAVIPASIQPRASNISFHSLQTFPENNYGFVELPQMEAEKVKKKLNGSILKGKRVRVEDARPSRKPKTPKDAEDDGSEKVVEHEEEAARPKKRRKKVVDNIITGVKLPKGRKVQRGWTSAPRTEETRQKREKQKGDKKETKKEKRQKKIPKSTYSEKDECLFRTKASRKRGADDTQSSAKKSKSKHSQDNVVHEFAQTTQFPTFLKDSKVEPGDKAAVKFVEGQGWVNEAGEVIDAAPFQSREKTPGVKNRVKTEQDSEMSPLQSSSDTSPSSSEPLTSEHEPQSAKSTDTQLSDARGSLADTEDSLPSPASQTSIRKRRASSVGAASILSISIPKPDDSLESRKPHPLEALFKRQHSGEGHRDETKDQATTANDTSFSFFAPDENEPTLKHGGLEEPQTPFTQKDFQQRKLRSAAPTPDTAAANKAFFWEPESGRKTGSDQETDGALPTQNSSPANFQRRNHGPSLQIPGTETIQEEDPDRKKFEERFWEKRGENNRVWKQKRREALKEKRKRDNRRRSAKGNED